MRVSENEANGAAAGCVGARRNTADVLSSSSVTQRTPTTIIPMSAPVATAAAMPSRTRRGTGVIA
jgi:hypothetical protein